MNKLNVRKRKNLEADLAVVEAKIEQHLENRANARRELDRLKFTTAGSTVRRAGAALLQTSPA